MLTTEESQHIAKAFKERFYWRAEACPTHNTHLGSVRWHKCVKCLSPRSRLHPGDEGLAEMRYRERCEAFAGYYALSFDQRLLHQLINRRDDLSAAIRMSRMFDDCRRDAPWRTKS